MRDPPLNYDPLTGILTWEFRPDLPNKINARWSGKEAGYINEGGYRWVEWSEGGVRHRHSAAVVIWFMQTGEWPADEVDHINRNPLDNRWSNLRAATHSEQMQDRERRKTYQWPKGVRKRKNCVSDRFEAAIAIDRKWMYLGMFATAEEAHRAYLEARERLHPRRPG